MILHPLHQLHPFSYNFLIYEKRVFYIGKLRKTGAMGATPAKWKQREAKGNEPS
jgi:hypothetical protein